jgi:hypothetical protein
MSERQDLLDKINTAVAAVNDAEKVTKTAQADLVSKSKVVGQLLLEAKELHPKVADFEAFLKRVNGLKLSRAYDLLRLAGGRTTDEDLRQETRERVRKHRQKKKLPKPEPRPEPKPVSVTSPDVTEPPKQTPTRITQFPEISIELRKRQNADLDLTNFEKIKKQVAELEQKRLDLAGAQRDIEDQQAVLVERANLTPKQAREIKKLLDEFQRKLNERPEQETAYDIVEWIVQDDDNRKRLAKEAKDPQAALNNGREREQREEMEMERDDAKQDARESGEAWSDIKDEWETNWIDDNWGDQQEQQFLRHFKEKWQRDHQREFPDSKFNVTSAKAEAA